MLLKIIRLYENCRKHKNWRKYLDVDAAKFLFEDLIRGSLELTVVTCEVTHFTRAGGICELWTIGSTCKVGEKCL